MYLGLQPDLLAVLSAPMPGLTNDANSVVTRCVADCDTCRWMAPEVFSRIGDKSAVHAQPMSREQRVGATQALLSCPTFSIHVNRMDKDEQRQVGQGFLVLTLFYLRLY